MTSLHIFFSLPELPITSELRLEFITLASTSQFLAVVIISSLQNAYDLKQLVSYCVTQRLGAPISHCQKIGKEKRAVGRTLYYLHTEFSIDFVE